jgi:hypothetical protein
MAKPRTASITSTRSLVGVGAPAGATWFDSCGWFDSPGISTTRALYQPTHHANLETSPTARARGIETSTGRSSNLSRMADFQWHDGLAAARDAASERGQLLLSYFWADG